MTHRPRLLVFNQYYWPGVEATAYLLTQLCEALVTEFDVTVVTGCLRETAPVPERTVRNGVEIIRIPSTAFDRTRLIPRAVNYISFLLSSLTAGLRTARPDIVVCMTDPPLLANIARPVARRFGVPLLVVTQDVFPEVAVALGRIEQPLLVGLLQHLIGSSLKKAEAVVAIGETMKLRLVAKGASSSRITVIPNWADTEALAPAPRDNQWARDHGLVGRFVLMHSGNVGYAQDLDTLVRASTFLRDVDDLSVVVVGTGARRDLLASLAERVAADSVQFLPYQDRDLVRFSLSTADIHFVGLASGLAGYVVPSRVYGIMATGRPMLVSAEQASETAQLVQEVGCGVVVPPGRPDLVAATVRELHGRHDELAEMGLRGLDYVRGQASAELAVDRYKRLLHELDRSS